MNVQIEPPTGRQATVTVTPEPPSFDIEPRFFGSSRTQTVAWVTVTTPTGIRYSELRVSPDTGKLTLYSESVDDVTIAQEVSRDSDA